MQVVTAVSGVVEKYHPAQGLRDLKNAGFERVCLDLEPYCPMKSLWYKVDRERTEGDLEYLDSIRRYYADFWKSVAKNGLDVSMGILPRYSIWKERREALEEKVSDFFLTCVSALEDAGCEMILIDYLYVDGDYQREKLINQELLLKLAGVCKKETTKLLWRNQVRSVGGHATRGICAEAEEAIEWIGEVNDRIGMERVGFCLDVGACNVCGQDMYAVIAALKEKLCVVWLRENDGRNPASYLPFCGHDVDWLSLIRGLREIDFDGTIFLDYGTTAGAFSPLLKPGILQVAKSVGDYFVWQIELEAAMKHYDSIVLFGAGNMCRNYMKNYGEAYPPLFTCDNNPDRWGEEFCGLEVKSPETLRDLPENCGVFICNIYYRETEEQLRGMGVENIEYFNDKYMATFHTDRLKRG